MKAQPRRKKTKKPLGWRGMLYPTIIYTYLFSRERYLSHGAVNSVQSAEQQIPKYVACGYLFLLFFPASTQQ